MVMSSIILKKCVFWGIMVAANSDKSEEMPGL